MKAAKKCNVIRKSNPKVMASTPINGPFALTEKKLQKSAILDGKLAWHPPLGHREQRKVKLDRLQFLCV